MHIIFGKPEAEKLDEKYITLELDTVKIQHQDPITVYCLIEDLPLSEFPKVEKIRELHEELMVQYRARNWKFCQQAIDSLTGEWGGQMDTFYQDLLARVRAYQDNEPDPSWNGILIK